MDILKIVTDYRVTIDKRHKCVKETENLESFLSKQHIFCKNDLEDFIYNAIWANFFGYELIAEEDKNTYNDYIDEIEIENIEELIKKYSYLIKEAACCDSENGNYCSKCGKKLK